MGFKPQGSYLNLPLGKQEKEEKPATKWPSNGLKLAVMSQPFGARIHYRVLVENPLASLSWR